MASPVLLVADDLSLIAAVKRVLAREGYECVLATSAADAVIAFGHLLPGVMLLQPSVESDRGHVILEELQLHPDARLLKAVLLGETIPGFPFAVEPLPIDGPHLAQTIEDNLRSADVAKDWTVREVDGGPEVAATPPLPGAEPEAWRVAPPSEAPAPGELAEELPEVRAITEDELPPPDADATPPPPRESSPSMVALTERLFGDLPSIEDELHRDLEAEVIASVDSTIARQRQDEELQRLEDEVLAEAQRRRVSRESRIIDAAALEAPPAEPPPAPASTLTDEESFGGLDEPSEPLTPASTAPIPPASRAREVLSRAEQMVLEGRAVSEAQRKVDEAEARRERAELEALERRAEHAESLVRRERETRSGLEDELERQRDTNQQLAAALERERTDARARIDQREASSAGELAALRQALSDAQAQLRGREDDLQTLQAEQAGLTEAIEAGDEKLNELERRRDEKIAELTRQREERLAELNRQQAESISALTRRHDERVAELRRELAEAQAAREISSAEASSADAATKALEAEKHSHAATRQALAEAEAARAAFEQENALVEQGHSEAELARQAAEEARDRAAAEQATLQTRLAALEARLTGSSELVDEASTRRAQSQDELEKSRAALQQALGQLAAQDAEALELRQELERAAHRHAATVRELAQLRDSLETARARAEEAEATASLHSLKVKELEHRELMPISLPGRRALGLARHGSVDLEGLARLICQLVLAQAELRVELGAAGGTRTLWVKKGSIVAARSDFEAESLIDRARRDGLIDGRQEAELRIMRNATLREQLEALRSRGFIRDIEAVPLVQRCAEQIALGALSEETSQYRLTEEPPGPEVMLVTVPRPALPLLAEGLRRAVPLDALLEQLGGGEAVPVPTDAEWDLRALGFSDRERKMLSWIDGEATVEDVSLASGLKPEAAFRALLVAKYLGVVELTPPAHQAPPVDAALDVHRLEAKFDEVQDADYFTILGLPRSAGAEDVSRAWQRLSTEFHPLRYSGHPDAVLQQRAQVVFGLLEEAAKALEDDRRRAEYARHLLD